MEIHQLRYFVAVVDSGGFGRAAETCVVSQPSLSQQIAKLERQLGHKLFDRLGRKVALTDAGAALLPRARRILSEIDEVEQGVRSDLEGGRGELHVGFIPTIAPFVLPRALQRFGAEHPTARPHVAEDFTVGLTASLSEGRLELGFMSLPVDSRQFRLEELADEPLLVAVPAQHPLARRKSVPLSALDGLPFIALHQPHCLGQQVSNFCYGHQLFPDVRCRTHQIATALSCVAMGAGATLVPTMAVRSFVGDRVAFRPIEGNPLSRTLVAVTHPARNPSLLARRFVDYVREALQEELSHTRS